MTNIDINYESSYIETLLHIFSINSKIIRNGDLPVLYQSVYEMKS